MLDIIVSRPFYMPLLDHQSRRGDIQQASHTLLHQVTTCKEEVNKTTCIDKDALHIYVKTSSAMAEILMVSIKFRIPLLKQSREIKYVLPFIS